MAALFVEMRRNAPCLARGAAFSGDALHRLRGTMPRLAASVQSATYKLTETCYRAFAPNPSTGRREFAMAKGQMKSNKEKKKPKADKNLKKGGVANVNPFASSKTPAGSAPNKK
jgi:hypothetical protein